MWAPTTPKFGRLTAPPVLTKSMDSRHRVSRSEGCPSSFSDDRTSLVHPPSPKKAKPSDSGDLLKKPSLDLAPEETLEVESSGEADAKSTARLSMTPKKALKTLDQPQSASSLANALLDPSPESPVVQPPRCRSTSFSKGQSKPCGVVKDTTVHSSVPFEQLALCLPPPSRGQLVLVPQPTLSHPGSPNRALDAVMLPTVTFQSKKGNTELGLGVGEVLADRLSCAPADLIGAMDSVFPAHVSIANVRIAWPCYETVYTSSIDTQNGKVTRGYVLMIIARSLMELAKESSNMTVLSGTEPWQFRKEGVRAQDLIITCLQHIGGIDWQPIIFAPSRSSSS